MKLENTIKSRRSIRGFTKKRINKDILLKIIDIARWAPSNCNTQGWRFIIVDNPKLQKKMISNGGSPVIRQAQQGILVLYDNQSDNKEYLDYVQSAAAAIQNMIVYAHSLGLGACWICHLPRKNVLRKIFRIPTEFDPIAYIAVGYPLKTAVQVKRKYNLQQIVSFNKFTSLSRGIKKSVFLKSIFRRCYYLLPAVLKKLVNPYVDRKFVKKFKN